jgi:hypothetical protein
MFGGAISALYTGTVTSFKPMPMLVRRLKLELRRITNSKENSANNQFAPMSGEAHAYRRKDGKYSADENGVATTEEIVERVGEPAGASNVS